MQGFMLKCISSWMTCRKRWDTMRNSIWSSSLTNVQCFFWFLCGWIYLNWCQFVVWIPEWSLWRTRVNPCLIMAWVWVNQLDSFLNLHFNQVRVPCPADEWFSLHPTSHANCILKLLLNLGPNCGKGMSRCVGMPWNAFLAYSTHEKVGKGSKNCSHSFTVPCYYCMSHRLGQCYAGLFVWPIENQSSVVGMFLVGWGTAGDV